MVKLFGSTVQETVRALRREKADIGDGPITAVPAEDRAKALFRLIASVALLAVGCYLVTQSDAGQRDAGKTLLGFIAGYWLR